MLRIINIKFQITYLKIRPQGQMQQLKCHHPFTQKYSKGKIHDFWFVGP